MAAGASRLRIVVSGLAATYPFGGVFWDYAQYLVGLRQLGHDVLYIEDTGRWCYDPWRKTFVEASAPNAALLERWLRQTDPALGNRWFFRDSVGRVYGREWKEVASFVRSCDLFLNLSGSCWIRDAYEEAPRLVTIDSDPMYTQASIGPQRDASGDEGGRSPMPGGRQSHFTFAENVGRSDCRVPTAPFHWQPTRQPIVLSLFEPLQTPVSRRRRVLTTVASWEPTEKGPVLDGIMYGGKSVEFKRFLDLPSRSAVPIEVAMSGPAPVEQLRASGWRVVDALEVSSDPWVYREYLRNSWGEWSVAKNAYVAGRTGWFSCRSACYLALGVPVIVQDTGFAPGIPAGEGVLMFRTSDEAVAAIDRLQTDQDRHVRAASEIAREYFNSDMVLGHLIDRAMSSDGGAAAGLPEVTQ